MEAADIAALREQLIRAVMEARGCDERAACEFLADYFALIAA